MSRSSRWRTLMLAGVLVATFGVWLFWPYPDPDPVLREFISGLIAQPNVIVSSVDAKEATSYRTGEEPSSQQTHDSLLYTYTTASGETWNELIPVLSSRRIDDAQTVELLLEGIVSEPPKLWDRSQQSARRRLSAARHFWERPGSLAIRELFGDDRIGRLGCIFSPDFEVRDANNPEARLLLCLGCLEVRCWYEGRTDWAYFGMDVRDRYLAFAKERGMEVSAKWRAVEE